LTEGLLASPSIPDGRETLPFDYRDSMIPRSARVSVSASRCGIGHDFSRRASSEQSLKGNLRGALALELSVVNIPDVKSAIPEQLR